MEQFSNHIGGSVQGRLTSARVAGKLNGRFYVFDPATNTARILARHESIKRAYGFYATQEGVLYYGSGATLMRCRPGI